MSFAPEQMKLATESKFLTCTDIFVVHAHFLQNWHRRRHELSKKETQRR